jgi:hypothetical protein
MSTAAVQPESDSRKFCNSREDSNSQIEHQQQQQELTLLKRAGFVVRASRGVRNHAAVPEEPPW